MSDAIAVVTGANAGLGYHTSLKLAQRGYTVVMACRSAERAQKARDELLAQCPQGRFEVLPLDLSEPASVSEFFPAFREQFGSLDLLVNNAGIVGVPLTRNSAGHELHLATNYLGQFALTGMLLPLFPQDHPTRIVSVSSLAHRLGKVPLDDIDWHGGEYKPMAAYARSKLAMQSFIQELARRLEASGSNTISVSAHPGFAATEIANKTGMTKPKGPVRKWFQDRMQSRVPTPDEASEPTMLAALGDDVKNGEYFGPGGFLEISGKPARAKINKRALDVDFGKQLWTLTEEMTGVQFLSDI
ncbi:SDR family NAD(P)-dependent oxidoreductase [Mangrovimicrobium sediminis]|uniref:SDR family NAD(P)-dependent oxidoreductase n=1 Tax=Mangrovimicrobium sediminis TaxID=2562682 RepID=A0A4Z0MA05_9GAMM|nr:SDR family NAD(P)-dependent oxidoreductase [Haliea sp. SAOS-164]TGD76230.1 SDR family NAD(P)-dependent oxidoreductase [Haliea sp. SAOS-164]